MVCVGFLGVFFFVYFFFFLGCSLLGQCSWALQTPKQYRNVDTAYPKLHLLPAHIHDLLSDFQIATSSFAKEMVGRLLMLPAGVNFKSCTRLFPCHRWDRESVQHPTQHSTSATLFHGGYVPLQQRKARYVRKRGCFEQFQGFLKCWNLTHDLYRRCSDRSEMCNHHTLVQLHWKSVWNSTLTLVVLRWHHGRERVKDATLWQWIDKSVVKGDPTAYKVNKNAVYCVMVYSILLNLFMQLDLVLEDWQSFLFQILF